MIWRDTSKEHCCSLYLWRNFSNTYLFIFCSREFICFVFYIRWKATCENDYFFRDDRSMMMNEKLPEWADGTTTMDDMIELKGFEEPVKRPDEGRGRRRMAGATPRPDPRPGETPMTRPLATRRRRETPGQNWNPCERNEMKRKNAIFKKILVIFEQLLNCQCFFFFF